MTGRSFKYPTLSIPHLIVPLICLASTIKLTRLGCGTSRLGLFHRRGPRTGTCRLRVSCWCQRKPATWDVSSHNDRSRICLIKTTPLRPTVWLCLDRGSSGPRELKMEYSLRCTSSRVTGCASPRKTEPNPGVCSCNLSVRGRSRPTTLHKASAVAVDGRPVGHSP